MDLPNREHKKNFEHMHAHWRKHLMDMSGGGDIRGIEIGSAIRMLANIYDHAISHNPGVADLSGPRMGILMRLMAEEDNGNMSGINPTRISHYQQVKKNTITSLLKGLEDQGLIARATDPSDRRGFMIHITPAGRDLIHSTAPARLAFMNQLASGLSDVERDELVSLLEKLRSSILKHSCADPQAQSRENIRE
jgi:DNA-binding MarR family transcriptional regulator